MIMYAGTYHKHSNQLLLQSMLVILSGSRDLHWLSQFTHKQALNVAYDLDESCHTMVPGVVVVLVVTLTCIVQ